MSIEVGKLYKVKLKDSVEQVYFCLLIFENGKIGLKDVNFPQGGEGIKTVSESQIESYVEITDLKQVSGEKMKERARVFFRQVEKKEA